MVSGLALAPDQSLWVATDSGVWFGTDDGASHRDAAGRWTHVTEADGITSSGVVDLFVEADGGVWFATREGVVHRTATGALSLLTTAEGLAHDHVTAVLVDSLGNRWFGTREGLSRLDGSGAWRTLTTDDGLASNWVSVLAEDAAGNVWVGTRGHGGVTRFPPDGSAPLTLRRGLPSSGVRAIDFSSGGTTWVATDYGVSRHNDATGMRVYRTSRRLDAAWTVTLATDANGNPWVGTNDEVRCRWVGFRCPFTCCPTTCMMVLAVAC